MYDGNFPKKDCCHNVNLTRGMYHTDGAKRHYKEILYNWIDVDECYYRRLMGLRTDVWLQYGAPAMLYGKASEMELASYYSRASLLVRLDILTFLFLYVCPLSFWNTPHRNTRWLIDQPSVPNTRESLSSICHRYWRYHQDRGLRLSGTCSSLGNVNRVLAWLWIDNLIDWHVTPMNRDHLYPTLPRYLWLQLNVIYIYFRADYFPDTRLC